jgi:3-deoxy-manno-octulosonate cytidylyltransferase (CMP-KDO synthetase)
MDYTVVIPARYASTRLPGKPLLKMGGLSMLRHVHQRAVDSGAMNVIIATDDERVFREAESFGATALMTSSEHPSGTDRIAEVARTMKLHDDEIVVNLQGDEPLMPPLNIHYVAEDLSRHFQASISTLCVPITSAEELHDPNVVKVVRDRDGHALFFSRAPVPWDRDQARGQEASWTPSSGIHYRHVGLYAYRAGFLQEYISYPSCRLEEIEALEQLRVLWTGGKIHVADAPEPPGPGVDTEDDYERVAGLFDRVSQVE